MNPDKFLCSQCGWHGSRNDLAVIGLTLPGGDLDEIYACPSCTSITSTIERGCQEPNCRNAAGCGTPFPGGYKFHCHLHPPTKPQPKDPT